MRIEARLKREKELSTEYRKIRLFTVCRKIYWGVDVLRKGRKLGEGRRALASP